MNVDNTIFYYQEYNQEGHKLWILEIQYHKNQTHWAIPMASPKFGRLSITRHFLPIRLARKANVDPNNPDPTIKKSYSILLCYRCQFTTQY